MKFKNDIEVQAGLKDSSGSDGTLGQVLSSTVSGVSWTSLSGFVPYTGATANVNLGTHTLLAKNLIINHPSGSGVAASITKGGSGEALTILKTSGSGNAASILGGITLLEELHLNTLLADSYIASAATWNAKQNQLNGTGFVRTVGTTVSYINGTSSQYVMGDGTFSSALNTRIEQTFIATAGQTTFSLTYDVGQVEVYYNGSKLFPNEFTATNGTSVVLQNPATLNAQISIVKFITPIGGGVTSFNTRTGAVTLTSTDVNTALGYTAANDANVVKLAGNQTVAGAKTFTSTLTMDGSGTGAAPIVSIFNTGINRLLSPVLRLYGSTNIGSNYVELYGSNATSNRVVQLPDMDGTITLGSGTTNYVPKFINSNTVGNSIIFDNGTNVGINTVSPTAKLSFGIPDIIGEIGRISFDVNGNQRTYIASNRHTAIGQESDLSFGTMSTERMRITSGGSVGIGVNNPSTQFNVSHASHGLGMAYLVSNPLPSIAGLFTDSGVNGGQGFGSLQIKSRTDFAGYSINFFTAATANAPVQRMTIRSDGNVGIGTASDSTTRLYVAGTGNPLKVSSGDNNLQIGVGYQGVMSGYIGGISSALYAYSVNGGYLMLNSSSAWVAASDAKRKRNFEKYHIGLEAIKGLQPKLYNMDFQEDGDEKQVGLVAQEVKEHIPLAYEDNNGFIGLNYNAIIVTMVNAIQEQQELIQSLTDRLSVLESK
jgi:hypothetical protein